MARGARRFYAYQSGRLALVPDELCHVEHTVHVVCGRPVDSETVLVFEGPPGQQWLDLWPWCPTCRQYIGDPRDLVKGLPHDTRATVPDAAPGADADAATGHAASDDAQTPTAEPSAGTARR